MEAEPWSSNVLLSALDFGDGCSDSQQIPEELP
jgi:hypothetical protein